MIPTDEIFYSLHFHLSGFFFSLTLPTFAEGGSNGLSPIRMISLGLSDISILNICWHKIFIYERTLSFSRPFPCHPFFFLPIEFSNIMYNICRDKNCSKSNQEYHVCPKILFEVFKIIRWTLVQKQQAINQVPSYRPHYPSAPYVSLHYMCPWVVSNALGVALS